MRYRLTDLETVREEGAWLFTVTSSIADEQEVLLLPCGDGVEAWVNRCTHEQQRLYREDVGAVTRDGAVVCPKHGSAFDTCEGDCENGPAAGSTLSGVEVTVESGQVYLTDDEVRYLHDGPAEDDDDDEMPSSSSHLQL